MPKIGINKNIVNGLIINFINDKIILYNFDLLLINTISTIVITIIIITSINTMAKIILYIGTLIYSKIGIILIAPKNFETNLIFFDDIFQVSICGESNEYDINCIVSRIYKMNNEIILVVLLELNKE